MSLLPISESDDFVVHYDPMKGMYRVTVFNDGHFWDEYWFDAYEEKELDISFPQTIGNITCYSKAELFEWVENQQKINDEKYQFDFKLDFSNLVNDCAWGALDCSHLTDEEIDRIVDELNKIPN